MSGDFSRDGFDALRDYAAVFLQQGRPVLDADWNEMVQVFEHRIRSATVDTIGRAVVPRETITGFEVRIAAGGGLEIGQGRMYVDGTQVSCFGAANYPDSGDTDFPAPVFDRERIGPDGPAGVLDQLMAPASGDFLDYMRQPYWPVPEALPNGGGPHLAYLVTWQREVTALEAPEILEPALGGVDTTTRLQTVWQVRVLPDVGAGATCATPDDQLGDWEQISAPSTARLTTDTVAVDDPENPCLVPPTDGYSGVENQLYRVQIHSTGADQAGARFKFSRENASVAAAIDDIAVAGLITTLTVRRVGRDEILRFKANDWVEVTDDHREFNHLSGQMMRVSIVHEDTREIELEGVLDADLIPDGLAGNTLAARHSRVVRWDQRGIIRRTDNTIWENLGLDTSDGLIPVPPAGTVLVLESGITVAFSTAPGLGGYRELDSWSFAARTAGTQVERLEAAAPHSVQRHYARLAVVTFPGTVLDCRDFWPPVFGGGDGCACTVCVTPESHASGDLTIQAAIDQIGPEGGTVCLSGGIYPITQSIRIADRLAITLRGQGIGTVITQSGAGPALAITGSVDVQVERLTVLTLPFQDATGATRIGGGIRAVGTQLLALRRVAVLVPAVGDVPNALGISLEGVCIGAKIEECLVVAPVALGTDTTPDDSDPDARGFLILGELRVLDNILFGTRAALRLTGTVVNIAGVIIARNLLFGAEQGAVLNWFSPPQGSTLVEGNTVLSSGDAMVLGVPDLMLQDNEISGGGQSGSGVRLVANLVPQTPTDAQIVGNRIGDLPGTGIGIEGRHGSLLIKRNVVRRCGSAGIATTATAVIDHIAVDNNVVEDIGAAGSQGQIGGIVLTQAVSAQILGNSLRGIGASGLNGSESAGIAVQGSGSVAINGNSLRQIGPDLPEARATAIVARPPIRQLSVQSNRINGVAQRLGSVTAWIAIEIGQRAVGAGVNPDIGLIAQPQGFMAAVPGIAAADLAFVTVAAETVSLSAIGLRAAAVRRSQIQVQGNQIQHAAELLEPMVTIVDTGASSVGFSHNQCDLDAGGGIRAIVLIGAPAISAAGNTIRHQSDSLSMLLSTGTSGVATPVGNITQAGIQVVPNGLNPPFDALNLFVN